MSRWLSLILVACWSPTSSADDSLYLRDVKPLFRARCYACHGVLKQESGLRLDTVAAILAGGDSGAVVVPGEPESSWLLDRLTAEAADERMPPDGPAVTPRQIQAIRAWIRQGAPGPIAEAPEEAVSDHWAFARPVRSEAQTISGPDLQNWVDALLEERRRAQGIESVEVAQKGLLLRRLYLDLIGLPPTADELQRFLADTRPDAYERVVDRLLANPHYGERWGRHWMDVWRYSDWYGLGEQLRFSQKHIWRWRDWIIESLNEDVGYDQMLVEMLAGDELAPTNPQVLRATGFLARNYYLFNRTTWLDNTIEHTSKAFLGLTMNCAKCHDHKYDPITHDDYYRMRAIFETHQVRLDPVPGQIDLNQDGLPRVFDAHPDAPTYVHLQGDEKQPDTSRQMQPNVPQFFGFDLSPQSIDLPLDAYWPAGRRFVLSDWLAMANDEISKAQDELAGILAASADSASRDLDDQQRRARLAVAEKRLAAAKLYPRQLTTAHAADLAKAHQADSNLDHLIQQAAQAARERDVALAEFNVAQAELEAIKAKNENEARERVKQARAELAAARDKLANATSEYPSFRASRRALEGPDESDQSRDQPYPRRSTGRRLAFARWLVRKDHPLTARVAVNHIWIRHFGQPLVETVTDFGRRAEPPTQRAVLDTLAVELMNDDWRMKPMHRRLVTSQAYRLAAPAIDADDVDAEVSSRERDPDNEFYGRRIPLRMESQVVRDSLLQLAGELDTQLGGPSIAPTEPNSGFRRSIYFLHSRDDRDRFLTMFDDADIFRCYRRTASVVPRQALALSNGQLASQMAAKIASQLFGQVQDTSATRDKTDARFVSRAFELVLCRQVSSEELNACRSALESWRRIRDGNTDTPGVSREYCLLVHALLNHNDFITIR